MMLKPNLKLRKVGGRYMIVDVSEADANITSVHTLNESAAFILECVEKHGTTDAARIASALCEEYDIEYSSAMTDVEKLLSMWRQAGLFVEKS